MATTLAFSLILLAESAKESLPKWVKVRKLKAKNITLAKHDSASNHIKQEKRAKEWDIEVLKSI